MYSRLDPHRPGAQRGAAALIVVLLLFFIISLVAAYAGRNLIFEQRTATNQYRATQAFEAAEAGLEWAVAMLNGGRVDALCAPSNNVANRSFRDRFLLDDRDAAIPQGFYTPQTWDNPNPERLRPSCIRNGVGWNCSCPDGAVPTPAIPAGGGMHPAFRVCFERVPVDPLAPLGPVQPGMVRIVSTGRTSVALSSALVSPPSAALTAVGNVSIPPAPPSTTLGIYGPLDNTLMISYGGLEDPLIPPRVLPTSLQGTPIDRLIRGNDSSLTGLMPGQMFASLFRMGESTYKNQPATVRVDCENDCSANTLQQKVQDNPGRIIWVDGNPTIEIDAAVTLGSVANPALIVASGSVEINAAAQITGLLYSSGNITITGDPELRGAVVAAGNFDIASGAPTLRYDPSVLKPLNIFTGSFVRVPGSWRDFQ